MPGRSTSGSRMQVPRRLRVLILIAVFAVIAILARVLYGAVPWMTQGLANAAAARGIESLPLPATAITL